MRFTCYTGEAALVGPELHPGGGGRQRHDQDQRARHQGVLQVNIVGHQGVLQVTIVGHQGVLQVTI